MSAPNAFICPITLNIMSDPYSDSDGNTFEKYAIFEWVNAHHNSPITRNPMTVSSLKPNRALKELIDDYLKTQNTTSSTTTQTNPSVVVTEDVKLDREPVNIIMVADVSGSMSSICDNKNSTESMNFTRLDLVRHTMNTIVESLTPYDNLGIIKFDSVARRLTNLIPVTPENKSTFSGRIFNLEANGGTNIWDALRVAIEMAKENQTSNSTHILLFTDGG